MEKLILLLLRQLLISKAVTATQIQHRILTEEDDDIEVAKQEGINSAYLDIAHLIDDLIRNAL